MTKKEAPERASFFARASRRARGLAARKGKKNGVILWPARIAMAGKLVTPCGAIEIAVLLGREEALRRLRTSLEKLQK